MKKSQSLNIVNYVHEEEKEVPITGIYSPDHNLSGWISERDFLIDEFKLPSIYNTFVGGQKYNIIEGSSKSDWNSIVLQNIDYIKLISFRYINSETWTPVYERGTYSIYWHVIDLFSSYHYSGILRNTGERFEIQLREDCVKTSIECAIWTRDENFVKYPYVKYEYNSNYQRIENKGPFSVFGTIVGSFDKKYHYPLYTSKNHLLKQSSFTNGEEKRYREIIFEEYPDIVFYNLSNLNFDSEIINSQIYPVYGLEGNEILDRKYIYTIKDDLLYTQSGSGIKIGTSETDPESIKTYWEYKNSGNPMGRSVFTNYFPIEKDSFKLFAVNQNNSVIELVEKENLNYEDESEYCYQIDYDLGIIQVGGRERVELFLLNEVSLNDKEIFIIDKFDLDSYPESGILKIKDELIFYGNKTNKSFYNCVRGYNNTVPGEYNVGESIVHIKNGKSINSDYKIYCKYNAVPKIRYEVSDNKYRFANNYGWLNLKPIDNIRENGIIQISSIDKNVSSLELTIDADLIYGNIFGPIYYGTDYRRLIATAKDALGNPVSDIEITIYLEKGPGYLNYSLKEFTSISNTDGEIYALYGVPYDWDSISKRVISMEHKNGNTELVIEPIPPKIPAESIQLYQILKHDPVLGTHGKKMKARYSSNSWSVNNTFFNKTTVTVSTDVVDEVSRFEFGFLYINLIGPNNEKMRFKRNIRQAIASIDEIGNLEGHKTGVMFVLNESIPLQYSAWQLENVIAFERTAEEFSEINLNGCRRVMYEWNDNIKNPTTNMMGAYYPIRPDEVDSELLIFNKLLPLPDPENINSNIGGYLVVSSDIANFYAECVDPITGNIIRSNKVRIRIDIPNYLNGVSNSSGLPIPYGFKLIQDEFNDCSGIGGATFLSINPFDYNISDLMLEIE